MDKFRHRPATNPTVSASDGASFKRITATLVWASMAVLFAAIAWQWPLSSLSVELGNWYMARDYQPITAAAVERVGKDADGSFTWFAARYEVAGKSFETGRMTLLEDEAIDVPANAAVMKTLETALRQNQPVTVWVSPRDPGVAVVSRDLSAASLWKRALFGGAFALIAVGATAGFVAAAFATSHYRNQKKAAPVWILVSVFWLVLLPIVWALIGPDDKQPITLVAVYLLAAGGLVAIGYAFYCLFKRD